MNAIVVVDQNWAIGQTGELLFSLPTDMKRFRQLTSGGTVLMGRKTLESFPGGKPLPKRRNIVLTRQKDFSCPGAEVVHSVQEALEAVQDTPPEQLWLIGGGSVYAALLDQCEQIFLTRVEAAAPQADAFFPNLDALPQWQKVEESEAMSENHLTFRFVRYRLVSLL